MIVEDWLFQTTRLKLQRNQIISLSAMCRWTMSMHTKKRRHSIVKCLHHHLPPHSCNCHAHQADIPWKKRAKNKSSQLQYPLKHTKNQQGEISSVQTVILKLLVVWQMTGHALAIKWFYIVRVEFVSQMMEWMDYRTKYCCPQFIMIINCSKVTS